jgi:hypothetical protein
MNGYKGVKIGKVISHILNEHDRDTVALSLGVTVSNLSMWMHRDHTPRFETACKIYGRYGLVVWPYAEEALSEALSTSS